MGSKAIIIQNLSKKYRDAEAFSVSNLTLEINRNEIFGLLGPNGAGKTTLISMLCGLIKPTSGKFIIEGFSYEKNSVDIKKMIGVVPQEYALYPTLTAKENLMYFGSMFGIQGKELKNKVHEALERLGLEKFADKQIHTFSGGMKRRVNILAGVLHQPSVLFLDEPTVGVDVQSKNVIIDYLKALNQQGTTIVYTSHHLSEAQDFCTQITIMDKGEILTSGTPKHLIESVPNASNLEDVFVSITGKALRDGL